MTNKKKNNSKKTIEDIYIENLKESFNPINNLIDEMLGLNKKDKKNYGK